MALDYLQPQLQLYEQAYEDTSALYYREQPSFTDILRTIAQVIAKL